MHLVKCQWLLIEPGWLLNFSIERWVFFTHKVWVDLRWLLFNFQWGIVLFSWHLFVLMTIGKGSLPQFHTIIDLARVCKYIPRVMNERFLKLLYSNSLRTKWSTTYHRPHVSSLIFYTRCLCKKGYVTTFFDLVYHLWKRLD